MSLFSVASSAAGAAASAYTKSSRSVASAGASVGRGASGVAATSAKSTAKPSGPTGVAAIANVWSGGATSKKSSPAVVKTISAAGKAAAAAGHKTSAKAQVKHGGHAAAAASKGSASTKKHAAPATVAKAHKAAAGAASQAARVMKPSLAGPADAAQSRPSGAGGMAERLGPGWSREASGRLKYESDLVSQLVIPGRIPADQFFSHIANGDYGRAGLALAAWVAEDALFVATVGGSQIRTAATRAPAVAAQSGARAIDHAVEHSQVQLNKAAGAEFQRRVGSLGAATLDNFVEEVSIRPNTATGPADFKVRIDGIGKNPQTTSINLIEAKGSATAQLTKNQARGFPLLEKYGGVVTGAKGAPSYPSGTPIAPGTRIRIIRPSDLE